MSNTTRVSYKSIGRKLLDDIKSVQADIQRVRNSSNLTNTNKTNILTKLERISKTVEETRVRFMKDSNALLAKGVSTANINKNVKPIVSSGFLTKKLQMNKTKIPKIMEMDAIMNKINAAQWKAAERIQNETNAKKIQQEKNNATKRETEQAKQRAKNAAAAKKAAMKRDATFNSMNTQLTQLKNRVGNNNRVVTTSDNTLNTLNARMAAARLKKTT